MFDPDTEALIRSALPLEGLDINHLPQKLTEAYSLVISARLGAIDTHPNEGSAEWRETLVELRRLAETYEGITIFLPVDDPHRASCAFVAGSSHFTLNQARRIQAQRAGNHVDLPSLTANAVSPEVAAALLFLIGGHHADAAETAKAFVLTGHLVVDQLLQFLAALSSGSGDGLRQIADATVAPAAGRNGDYLSAATDTLWLELSRAIQIVARNALGLEAGTPAATIRRVIDRISAANGDVRVFERRLRIQLTLGGPYHVARLLLSATESLLSSAVVAIPPPSDIDPKTWRRFAQHFARQRPFFWRNHIKAIGEGFLEIGRSFVLTFPTGAGKTTITELRIAAELLRGRSVVFLAPTRALVDQIAAEVTRTTKPIAGDVMRGRFLEDFGEKAGAKVFVQTPEQCLAYLSYDPQGHQDVGLVIVDECHQLSGGLVDQDGAPAQPTRRSVDAMWTLLALLHRSPGADVVLISAMVRNGAALAEWLETATTRSATVLDLAWKPTRQVRGVVAYDGPTITTLENEIQRRRARRNQKPGAADKRGLWATPVGLFCHTQVWDTASSFGKFPLISGTVPLGLNNYWKLSANRNEVGGRLLSAMVRAGIRPMVFSQRIDWTHQIAEPGAAELRKAGVPSIELTQQEADLFAAAVVELGDAGAVERPEAGRIGVHHGLLLLPERLAIESAFRRPNGLWALVATPTVAQGINLPAEVVIIAGDDRWNDDASEAGPETLAVHELLNAAGRAGRAGHYAHGIVIDLPGKVFTVTDGRSGARFTGLSHVMALFGQPDQCLDVVDPITQVLDRIAGAGAETDVAQYIVRRAGGLPDEALASILRNAFGNAQRAEREEIVQKQALLLKSAARTLDTESGADAAETEEWIELATQAGLSPMAVARVAVVLSSADTIIHSSFSELLASFTAILTDHSGLLFNLVDPSGSGLDRIMPRRTKKAAGKTLPIEDIATWENRWRGALRQVLPQWLSGTPIKTIGDLLHRSREAKGHVKSIQLGRRFALQAAGGVGHSISIIARIVEKIHGNRLSDAKKSWLQLVGGCVREGFDRPDKLLVFWHLRQYPGLYPRVRVHTVFRDLIQERMPKWRDLPEIEERRRLIRDILGNAPP